MRKNGVSRVEFDCNGNIYASKRRIEDKSFEYELQKFDVDLNYLFSITSYPNFLRQRKKYNPFRYSLKWDLTQNNNLVFGSLGEYKIYVLDSNGKLIKRIEKQNIPVEISTEEKNSAKESIPPGYNLVLPKYHTAYRWIFVGDGDKIYVETWEKTKDGEFYLYDVFDNEGKYIAKIPSKSLQKSMLCWKYDKFYAIERDEEGYQYVKRCKVTWKI